jgi:hypothetical protein
MSLVKNQGIDVIIACIFNMRRVISAIPRLNGQIETPNGRPGNKLEKIDNKYAILPASRYQGSRNGADGR